MEILCWCRRFDLWYTPAMIRRSLKSVGILVATIMLTAMVSGCTTGKPQQPDEVYVESMTVPLDFASAWQLTRDVLLEEEVEIYTRDKRGLFVVFTETERRNLITPWRTKLTITLREATPDTTEIAIESVAQRYSVSALTYPGWRDRSYTEKESPGTALLETIKSRIVQN